MSVNYRLPGRNNVILSVVFFLASLLTFASTASAQGYRVDGVTQARSGFPAAAVTIAVCAEPAIVTTTPCSTLTTLYTDSTLATPCTGTLRPPPATSGGAASSCSNPLVADGLGNYHYYVSPGRYALQFYGSGITTYTQRDQVYPCDFSQQCKYSSLNGVLYVGNGITVWGGADIGAQINSAYAALPSRGGRIHVIAQGSCYVATTAISFATNQKPVLLEGDPGGASCISYASASTSIIAVLLDWGVNDKQAAGVRDLQIIGPGIATTSTGFMLGSANGAEEAVLSGIKCGTNGGANDGFGTCVGMGINNNDFIIKIEKSQLINSTVGLGVTQGSEGIYVADSAISRNTTGVNNTTATNLYISSTSIDDNSTGISASGGGAVECYDCHFENIGVSAGSASYVVLTNSSTFISYGGSMQDDQISGTTTQFIQATSGACYVGIKDTLFTTLGRTLTQIVTFGGSCRGNLQPRYFSTNVLSDFNQAFTGGPILDCPIGAQIGVNNVCGMFGLAWQFRNGSGFVATNGGNLYTFAISNPSSPKTWALSDNLMSLWGGLSLPEITMPSGGASIDVLAADSVTHTLSWNINAIGTSSPTGAWSCTNVTPVTVNTSTTADQNTMTCTIPAGILNRVNRTLRVAASGVYSTPAASTAQMTVKLKLCTVSGCGSGTVITPISIQSTALGTVQITNDNWSLSSLSTTQTAGASSAYEAHGDFLIDLSTLTTAADSAFGDTNTATVGTIDSTAQLFLQCTFAFSAASASNTATQRQLVVETVN